MNSIDNMQIMISTNPLYNKDVDKFKNSDLPVLDFAEVMAEKMGFPDKESFLEYYFKNNEPVDKKEADKALREKVAAGEYGDVQIAEIVDFSKCYSFYPTGDHGHDYQVQMGINYNRTCYDGTNRRDYDKLTAAEDFTGMSAAEIYKAIYEKYQHCYGKNFLDINAVPYVAPPHSEDFYGGLLDRFYSELEAAIGGTSERQKACREALYGDMSDYEIRAAIVEKYSSDGTLTNSDLYKIAKTMDQCGVGGGIHNVLSSVLTKDSSQIIYRSSLGIKTSVEEACAMYEEMLASPLDPYMLDGIESHSKAMGWASAKLYSALDQLRGMCGAYSGGVSVSSVPQSSAKDDFVWIKI